MLPSPSLSPPSRTHLRLGDAGLPPGWPAAAVYANGAYAAAPHHVAGHESVLWIDTNGSNPSANVLDVEPGDATPARAAAWVQQRLVKHPNSVAIIYTMRSSWQAVKDHVAHLPKAMQDKVQYWIADPTGVDHMVPGSDATQWYWGRTSTSAPRTVAHPSEVRAADRGPRAPVTGRRHPPGGPGDRDHRAPAAPLPNVRYALYAAREPRREN